MPSTIQIRNVPDLLHRTLKSRAALAGMSLSDYLLAKLRRIAANPTAHDLRARLHALPPVTLDIPPADSVRRERDAR